MIVGEKRPKNEIMSALNHASNNSFGVGNETQDLVERIDQFPVMKIIYRESMDAGEQLVLRLCDGMEMRRLKKCSATLFSDEISVNGSAPANQENVLANIDSLLEKAAARQTNR